MDEGKTDVVYKKTPQRDLMLTFLSPIEKNHEKAPVYFLIPGGGWHVEDRQEMLDFSARSVQSLRNKGFAVVSIDYRVCGEGVVMREIIADCFDAARFISHFSDKFSIDKERFVLSGLSSGGHLALMLAYAPHDSFMDSYEFSDDFTVKSVAVMSPPTILYDNKICLKCLKGATQRKSENSQAQSPMSHQTALQLFYAREQVMIVCLHHLQRDYLTN